MDVCKQRYRGSLLGLAVGDAVGVAAEFMKPGSFEPVRDMIGGGLFRLAPGQWTDDTSMMLCLAASLVETGGFDPIDQLNRYIRWRDHGYMSVVGECFDIGNTVAAGLEDYEATGKPYREHDPWAAGNGSIMRLAPVPLFFAKDPYQAVFMSGESSRTTHGAYEAIDCCRYLGGLIVGASQGVNKDTLLRPFYEPAKGIWYERPLSPKVAEVASGSFKRKCPPDIEGSGYSVKCLEAALWAFHNSTDFEHGLLMAVNLGWDADTTGAVYGELAGAYYGEEAIPLRWRSTLSQADLIASFADSIYELATQR